MADDYYGADDDGGDDNNVDDDVDADDGSQWRRWLDYMRAGRAWQIMRISMDGQGLTHHFSQW